MPEAGGLLDQPAGMLDKMAYLADVYAAEQAYRSAKNGAEWAGNNPKAHELIGNVRRLERELKNGA